MAEVAQPPVNGVDVPMKEEVTDFTSIDNATDQPQANQTLQPQTGTSQAGPTQSANPMARTSQTATPAPPSTPNPHGSSTRIYLNQNVTPHLLEAMKYLAVHEPEKPLKYLAEFLAKRSAEIEGS